MGKGAGTLALTVGLGVVGGFVGGLFTAGAFSSTGAALGVSLAGFLTSKPGATGAGGSKPTLESASYDASVPEFAGVWEGAQGLVTCVGRDKAGDPAGVLVKTKKKKAAGKGGSQSVKEESYFLTAKFDLGRSMGGTLFDPDELFVDKGEIEDADGRRCFYDRDGATAAERGFELVQTVSSLTGRVICETSDTLRFYTGTAEQMPDPQLQNLWGERLSAGRGMASVVLWQFEVKSQSTFYWTVRSATTGRLAIIERRLSDCGIPARALDLSGLPAENETGGTFTGRVVTGQSVREVCEKAARRVWRDFAFNGQQIVVTDRAAPTRHVLSRDQIGARSLSGGDSDEPGSDSDGRLMQNFKAPSDFASQLRVSFPDINQGYEGEPAIVPRADVSHVNVVDYDAGEALSLGEALALGRAVRDEDAHQDCEASFSVLPGCEDWLVGDVASVPLGIELETGRDLGERDFLLLELHPQPNGSMQCSGVPHAAHVYEQPVSDVGAHRPALRVLQFAAPIALAIDCAALSELDPDTVSRPGLLVATTQSEARNFSSTLIRVGTASDSDRYAATETTERAIIGELTAPFDASNDFSFAAKTLYGELSSSDETGGARNLLAFENGLLVQFEVATPTGYDAAQSQVFYALSGLRAGRFGSDYALETLTTGTRFALLRDENGDMAPGVQWLSVPSGAIGRALQIVAESGGTRGEGPKVIQSLDYKARNMEALSPTIERATFDGSGALLLNGRARTRYALDNFENTSARHRMSEPRFGAGYKFRVALDGGAAFDLLASDDRASFDFTLSSAQLGDLAGSDVSGTIAQYGTFGPGRTTAFEAIL